MLPLHKTGAKGTAKHIEKAEEKIMLTQLRMRNASLSRVKVRA
jgi:hypothetical protein